jgi:hypothetical protein
MPAESRLGAGVGDIRTKTLRHNLRECTVDRYATHLPVLVATVCHTEGPVLELGSGHYSTPILSALCARFGRDLVTVDCDPNWLSNFAGLESKHHRLVHAADWERCQVIDDAWGLAFIDHAPAERRTHDIRRLKDRAGILVVHDTEDPVYGYENVLAEFAWVVTCKRYTPWTSILSNKSDLLEALTIPPWHRICALGR